MKKDSLALVLVILLPSILIIYSFTARTNTAPSLNGAWRWQEGSQENTICFVDGYCVFTSFDKQKKIFDYTWGGPYRSDNKSVMIDLQFNTRQKDLVGTTFSYTNSWKGNKLLCAFNGGREQEWTLLDDGKAALAGVWRISGRKQGDNISEMPLGARRTLKILSGSRFQWAAINIETKEFFGTGGGNYTFEKGKYTENIEFFSRDSSRVGASLSFDGKIEDGKWHHSGLSSRGEPIYEIWTRLK